jgi:hypothetical protein
MATFATCLEAWGAVFGFLAYLLAAGSAFAGDPARQTEIVLIGTVHKATANFKQDDLVGILERLNPGLILFEVDSSFLDHDSPQLLPQYRKISMEAEAVTTFQGKSHVPVHAYDIEGRNQFYQEHNYFDLQAKRSQALGNLYRQHKLEPEASALFEIVVDFDGIRDAIMQDRPEVINSRASDAAIERKLHYAQVGIRRIIEVTPSLAQFAAFTDLDSEFWERRNKTMVNNILKSTKDFSGKRIVVICGFEHRYFLIRLLQAEEARAGFMLREFWSYTQ